MKILPTTVVGSYPQPDWLIDRKGLGGVTPPRIRMREIWRVSELVLSNNSTEPAGDEFVIFQGKASLVQ